MIRFKKRRSTCLCVFAFGLGLLSSPAQDTGAEPQAAAATEELIAPPENTEADDADAAIRAHLETIFANVDDLVQVKVSVKNGVVRLHGSATGDIPRSKAETVAKGLDGVVYIDNNIVQTTDVGERLSPTLTRFYGFLESLRAHLPVLGVAIGVFVLFWFIGRLVSWLVRCLGIVRSNLLLRNIVANLLRVAIVMIGLYLALEIAGATTIVGAVLGAAGVVGLALSFAFRDIIENYLASVILSLRHPFEIKDRVEIDGQIGRVIRLTSSETLLMTDDGNHCRLPNSNVFKGTITNFTRNPQRRFSFGVGIGNSEDLSEVESIALGTLGEIDGILDDPKPTFAVKALGDSSVAVSLFAWIDQSEFDFSKVQSFAIRSVKEALDAAGIDMPTPIYEVNLKEQKGEESPRDKRPHASGGQDEKVDLSPETHIDSQIDAEQAADPDDNLLSS